MDLVIDKWNTSLGVNFNNYLYSIRNEDKINWTKNIVNTNMEVLAIKSPVLKSTSKDIIKGNYLSFLDLKLNDYYENTVINGILIASIKDFDLMKKYLDDFVLGIDNWATCDLLSFNVKGNESKFFNLSLEYIKSDKPFIRRVGLSILFNFIKDDDYIDNIFDIMNMFYLEEHYYVNMMISWLFCECFVKRRDKTIEFLKDHKLNKFVINKGVSKCRDSYRVSSEDKEMLLNYKIK